MLELKAAAVADRDEEVIAIYSGPFLEGVDLRKRPQLEAWRDRHRLTYARIVSDVLMRLAQHAEHNGDWRACLDFTARHIEIDPLDVNVSRCRVRSLAALGQEEAAGFEVARLHRTRRVAGLGISRSLKRELANTIRSARPVKAVATSVTDSTSFPFVGRTPEFNRLRARWTYAAAGDSQSVLLLGEPGIGKTRIAEHLARAVAVSGGRTHFVSCLEHQRQEPFSCVMALLNDSQTAGSPLEDRPIPFSKDAAFDDSARLLPAPSADSRAQNLLRVTFQLLHSSTNRQPLMVVVEDIQWADQASIRLLQHVICLNSGKPLLLLFTARSTERRGSSALSALLAGPEDVPFTLMELGPLSQDDARDLAVVAANRLDLALSSRDATRLAAACGGRPLLVVEFVRAIAEGILDGVASIDGPVEPVPLTDRVASILERRLRGLTTGAADLLGCISVAGRIDTSEFAAQVLGMPRMEIQLALEELSRLALVSVTPQGIAPVHAVLQTFIYETLDPARRAFLHEQIAVRATSVSPPRSGEAARHFQLAGCRESAFAWALAAAEECQREFALEEAEHYGRMACKAATGSEDLVRASASLADILCQTHRSAEALPVLENAVRRSSSCPDGPFNLLLASVRLEAALSSGHQKDVARGMDLLRTALRTKTPVNAVKRAFGAVAAAAHHTGRSDIAHSLLPLLEETAKAADENDSGLLLALGARLQCVYGEKQEARRLAAKSLEVGESSRDRGVVATTLGAAGVVELCFGDVRRAESLLRRAWAICCEKSDGLRELVVGDLAIVLGERGLLEEANGLLRQASEWMTSYRILFVHANRAAINYDREQWTEVDDAANRLLGVNALMRSLWADTAGNAFLGHSALARRDSKSASRCYLKVSGSVEAQTVSNDDTSYAVIFCSRFLASEGQVHRAVECLTTGMDGARQFNRWGRARMQLELGLRLSPFDRDRAWRLCRDVETLALECGADLLRDRAQEIQRNMNLT